MPIVAAIAGVCLLGERLHWYEPVGALVILAGVAVTQGRVRLPRRVAAGTGEITPAPAGSALAGVRPTEAVLADDPR